MAIQMVKVGESVNDGTGDPARTCFTKINQNFTDSANAASRQVGTEAGNVMEVGAFGLGADSIFETNVNLTDIKGGFFKLPDGSAKLPPGQDSYDNYGIAVPRHAQGYGGMLFLPYFASNKHQVCYRAFSGGDGSSGFVDVVFKTNHNTSVDSNGFIKAASPIVKLFTDKIELNDEASQQSITYEKLGVGEYLVKGSLGFAQEGWYIEMPKDANGNVLVAVVYEQLANNDISVKTYAKMFDPDTGDIVPNTARPRDIPVTRWIDLRLQALPQPDITPTDNMVTTNA